MFNNILGIPNPRRVKPPARWLERLRRSSLILRLLISPILPGRLTRQFGGDVSGLLRAMGSFHSKIVHLLTSLSIPAAFKIGALTGFRSIVEIKRAGKEP